MLVRQALPGDIEAMHRVRLAVRENRLTRSVITPADYLDAIEVSGRGWVALLDGVLRGFAVTRNDGHIWALFVEPGFERLGMGRALHDAMLRYLRDTRVAQARLETEPGTRAEAFYRRAGWRHAGMTDSGDACFTFDVA